MATKYLYTAPPPIAPPQRKIFPAGKSLVFVPRARPARAEEEEEEFAPRRRIVSPPVSAVVLVAYLPRRRYAAAEDDDFDLLAPRINRGGYYVAPIIAPASPGIRILSAMTASPGALTAMTAVPGAVTAQ